MLCAMTQVEEITPRVLPDALFIFVDQANPVTEHSYRVTKTFSSRFAERLHLLDTGQADPMPFIPSPDADPMPTPFVLSVTNDFQTEWNAELGRRPFAPRAPSRMSGALRVRRHRVMSGGAHQVRLAPRDGAPVQTR